MMNKTNKLYFIGAALVVALSSCSNYKPLSGSAAVARAAGWTETTHGDSVAPNYEMVFPQNKVNRMDITIKAEDWKLMQDNMAELFGSGGSGGFPGGAGAAFPGGFPGGNFTPGTRPSGFPRPSGSPGAFPAGFPIPPDGAVGAFPPDGQMPPGRPGGGGGGLEFSEEDPIYRPATIKFDGKTWEKVGIRYKGNSSLRSSWGRTLKMPFRFDFDELENEHPEVKNQRFYGFKRLTLSSGFTDNSLIREKVVADIFREAGVPSAQTAFYRIYIDYGEGSKYFGLYTMVEAPDKPMLGKEFTNPEGNLYKPSGTGAQFVTFNEKSFPKKTNETSSDWTDIKAVFSALHADRSDSAKWRAGLERVLDMEGYLNYLAVNTLIQNWDTYGRMAHNYYLYTDPSDKLVHWIPWDNNMALGGSMGGGGMIGLPALPATTTTTPAMTVQQVAASPSPATGTVATPAFPGQRPGGQAGGMGGRGGGAFSLDLTSTEVGNNWPLIRYIIDDPVYRAKYVDYVAKARTGAFAVAATKNRYQAAQALIRPYVIGPEGEQKEATLLSSAAAFEGSLNELYTHLESRHTAAQEFLTKNGK